jgi:hypothetical protein
MPHRLDDTVGRAVATVSPGIEIPPQIAQWVALRRVRLHRVLKLHADQYVDSGHPVPEYVRTALNELLDRGHVRLSDRRGDGRASVEVTESGDELFATLDDRP